MLRDQVDIAVQEITQTLGQSHALCDQVVPTRQIHQEIHIAVWLFLAPGDRAEHTQTRRATLRSQAVQACVHLTELVKQHVKNEWSGG